MQGQWEGLCRAYVLTVMCVLAQTGCDDSAGINSKAVKAIESVLVLDHNVCAQANEHVKQGSTVPDTLDWLVKSMQAIDTSECPPDFREAYARHVFAWERMARQVRSEPHTFAEGLGMGLVNYLSRGETDGGQSRIAHAHDQRLEEVESSWGEVEALTARYGAKRPQ